MTDVFPKYPGIDRLDKWPDALYDGEQVVITEKIHGANARFMTSDDGQFLVGSKNSVKGSSCLEDPWLQVAFKRELHRLTSRYPGMVFYGEVYGKVQDLKYDLPPGEFGFALFDVYDTRAQAFLSWDEFKKFSAGIPTVPLLYMGPWSSDLVHLAEGRSMLANHVREGFVVRPRTERRTGRTMQARCILKVHGTGFKERHAGSAKKVRRDKRPEPLGNPPEACEGCPDTCRSDAPGPDWASVPQGPVA